MLDKLPDETYANDTTKSFSQGLAADIMIVALQMDHIQAREIVIILLLPRLTCSNRADQVPISCRLLHGSCSTQNSSCRSGQSSVPCI
jgi:hypothetical protein